MNTSRFHFRLGLFTLGTIALAIVAILVLGHGTWFRETITAETYFDQSVSGLTVGAPVRHRGVDVGRVTKIGFVTSKYKLTASDMAANPHRKYSMANLILVEMTIDREAVRPLGSAGESPADTAAAMVKDGLRMRLVTSLLGGGGYIDADFVSDTSRSPPPDISWTPDAIYIPSEPTSANRLIDSLDHIAGDIEGAHPGDVIRHIDDLAVDIKRVTAGIDGKKLQGQASDLLADLNRATTSIQKILDDPHITALLTDASAAAGNVRALSDPDNSNLARLIADLRTTIGSLNALLEQPALKQAITNLGPITNDARQAVGRLSELLASEQQELADIIRSLKASAQNIEAVTDDAKQNPARLFFGQPPPKRAVDSTKVPQ